jgi:chromosome segregation ATPase
MKKRIDFFVSLSMVFFLIPGIVDAQTDKKAIEIKKLETSLATAKKNVAKYERSVVIADSIIAKGTEQINESKTETKAIATERKTLDKEYSTKAKSFGKLLSSKDKAEATQAKADMKALDLKYKADSKALDAKLKATTTKSTAGSSNLDKGKAGKKTATDGLKTAQAALEAAQEKYDIATGAVTPEEEGKKKRD